MFRPDVKTFPSNINIDNSAAYRNNTFKIIEFTHKPIPVKILEINLGKLYHVSCLILKSAGSFRRSAYSVTRKHSLFTLN